MATLDFSSLGGETLLLSPPSSRSSRGVRRPRKLPPAPWPAEPFPEDRPPDLVCRSSDGVDFDAHKEVLSALSGRLLTDISAAERAGCASGGVQTDAKETKPVIHINAPATVLAQLMRLCYSRRANPWVRDPDMVADLTLVVQEYRMDGTLSHAVEELWAQAISAHSLRAYFAAATRGLRGRAVEAAKATVFESLDGVYICELEDIPALLYHRLLDYHTSYRTAATAGSFPASKRLVVGGSKVTSKAHAPLRPFDPVALLLEDSRCGNLPGRFGASTGRDACTWCRY